MRKRRRLANKMTIMVCAVLLAVSAFFYAPMDVSAEEIGSNTSYLSFSDVNRAGTYHSINNFVWNNGVDDNGDNFINNNFYRVVFNYSLDIQSSSPIRLITLVLRVGNTPAYTDFFSYPSGSYSDLIEYEKNNVVAVVNGYTLNTGTLQYDFRFLSNGISSVSSDIIYGLDVVSILPLTGEESESYQNGYNAGYSAGEEAGESNGYSSGYSDGYEAGEQSGYDSGFQAGKDSVDTQSYYDAGYSAGYDAGYSSGYDTGYDEGYDAGWSAYEEQMDKWGADTTDYPLLIEQTDGTFDLQFDFIQPSLVDDVISDYCDIGRYYSGIDFNPNHTYRLDFTYHDFEYDYSDSYFTAAYSFWLYWGSCSFPITVGTKDDITSSFYISGDQIGTGLKFRCDVSGLEAYSEYFGDLHYYINDCTLKLYDMGPSGDTQNHIANQTDQLTNGYDDSKGNQVNSDLSTGLNDYEIAENSLFATAITGLKDFTFFDFESVPAMITGMSFIGSIMGSWFNQAGGASGVGIVLSILFSVILVAMVLGLYRWYQSRGGKN